PRERPPGGPDPDPAGGGREAGPPDAAGRLRGRVSGPDRIPAPGHDRRRALRARDGTTRRHAPVAHPRPPERPRVPEADEVQRAVLQRTSREEARGAARMGDEG